MGGSDHVTAPLLGRSPGRRSGGQARDTALTAAGCDEVFVDKASGTLARRPELDKALLAANRTGDQLVVTKLDRLGHSLEHLIDLSKQLQTTHIDLVVLDQGIDTSTAVGRMFFQILGAIAEFKHALMSERTIDGLSERSSDSPAIPAARRCVGVLSAHVPAVCMRIPGPIIMTSLLRLAAGIEGRSSEARR